MLHGGTGNDTLEGGAGNDTSSGDAGNNVYLFGRGDGQDNIRSNDSTAGKLNVLQFKEGSQYSVEEFRTSDGHVLIDTQVQNLVQAMASFAPPPPGQTTLTPTYQDSLAPLLAASWK
jgi:Ca2+-binding RTX toxin-like protein